VSADALAGALLGPQPLAAVRALRPSLDGALAEVADAALRRLGGLVAPGSPEAELLLLVSGRPGLSAAELTALFPAFEEVVPALLEDDLVSDRRFERTDCWSRTGRGAAAVRALQER